MSEQMTGLLSIGPDDSNANPSWLTPPDLLTKIAARYNGGIPMFDPCPYPRAEFDGLEIPWKRVAFVNPPYGSGVGKWFEKAIAEISAGRCEIAIFLVHARTDTKWFHDYILGRAQELLFVRGRVSFIRASDGKSAPSPFPSILAVFHANPTTNALVSTSWGKA